MAGTDLAETAGGRSAFRQTHRLASADDGHRHDPIDDQTDGVIPTSWICRATARGIWHAKAKREIELSTSPSTKAAASSRDCNRTRVDHRGVRPQGREDGFASCLAGAPAWRSAFRKMALACTYSLTPNYRKCALRLRSGNGASVQCQWKGGSAMTRN
jgi:hypothetical protein